MMKTGWRIWAFLLMLLLAPGVFAAEVRGVNLTLDEKFGARQAALGDAFIGLPGDLSGLADFPPALLDLPEVALGMGHESKFGRSGWDHLSAATPLGAGSAAGFALGRFETPGIGKFTTVPLSYDPETFSAVDHLLAAAFARRWGDFDAGASLMVMARQLDQQGFGMRGDLALRWRPIPWLSMGVLCRGALPSFATWGSGTFEYEPSDVNLGLGLHVPSAYFYGSFHLAWQSRGWFQQGARSSRKLAGERAWENPWQFLTTGSAAVEYRQTGGVTLQCGFPEAGVLPGAGIGYLWRGMISVDYGFRPHPMLPASHFVSFTLRPGRIAQVLERREPRPGGAPAHPAAASPAENPPPTSGASPPPVPVPEEEKEAPESEILETD